MRRVVFVAVVITIGIAGCTKAASTASDAAAATVASTTTSASAAALLPPPPVGGIACASPAGQIEIAPKLVAVKNVSDVIDVAVAATSTDALITFAVDGDQACDHDGCYTYHEAHSLGVDAAGKASAIKSVPNSSLGISASVDAAPFVLGSDLLMMTQGHAGAAATRTSPTQEQSDTIYVVQNGSTIQKSEKWFSGKYAVSAGGFAIGTGIEWAYNRKGNPGPPSVRTFRFFKDKPMPAGELVVQGESEGTARYNAPAIAFGTNKKGEELVAIAYRQAMQQPPKTTTLFAAWVDPKTLKTRGRPIEIAKGDVGAPSLLIDVDETGRDKVEIVFSSRLAGSTTSYDLSYVSWLATEAKPRPIAPILPNQTNTIAPAVAKVNGKFALAFTAAEGEKKGAVWAGFGPTLHDAAIAATQRSAPEVKNARDPEWGVAEDRALLVWTEHDGPRKIRYSWCH